MGITSFREARPTPGTLHSHKSDCRRAPLPWGPVARVPPTPPARGQVDAYGIGRRRSCELHHRKPSFRAGYPPRHAPAREETISWMPVHAAMPAPKFPPEIFPKQREKGHTRSWPMGVQTLDPLPLFRTRKSLPAPCGLRREAPNIYPARPLHFQDALVSCGVLWFKPDTWERASNGPNTTSGRSGGPSGLRTLSTACRSS